MENIKHLSGEIPVDAVLNTDGSGLWSRRKGPVKLKKLEWKTFPKWEDPDRAGENETYVRIYLDGRSWQNHRDGLVYTDKLFLQEARILVTTAAAMGLVPKGLPWGKLSYTEQGMQGGHYRDCKPTCRKPGHRPSVSLILGSW